jgi:hypothetical protein
VLLVGQFAFAAQVFAGDGFLVITRDVPYQSAAGPRHTGQVTGVQTAPDVPMLGAGSAVRPGAVTELTDHESAAIAGRVQGQMGYASATVQSATAQAGLASGKFPGAGSDGFAPASGLGSLAGGFGMQAGSTVGRATSALGQALSGALAGVR